MIIGLIGAQNSHARHFCETINKKRLWADVSIRYVYGADDPAECRRLCDEFGLKECGSEEEVIEKSDGVVITYRKGSLHYEPAIKALKAGKAVFNDKPFCTDVKKAEEIIRYAQENGLLLTGGTNLKGLPELSEIRESIRPGSVVTISFAADPASEYDGYWFYGIHAAELCLTLCGYDFTDVQAFRNDGAVVSQVAYPDKLCMLVTTPYSHDLVISVSNGGKTVIHRVPLSYQSVGPQEFVTMAKTGNIPWKYQHFLKSVELVSRIVQSAQL